MLATTNKMWHFNTYRTNVTNSWQRNNCHVDDRTNTLHVTEPQQLRLPRLFRSTAASNSTAVVFTVLSLRAEQRHTVIVLSVRPSLSVSVILLCISPHLLKTKRETSKISRNWCIKKLGFKLSSQVMCNDVCCIGSRLGDAWQRRLVLKASLGIACFTSTLSIDGFPVVTLWTPQLYCLTAAVERNKAWQTQLLWLSDPCNVFVTIVYMAIIALSRIRDIRPVSVKMSLISSR